MQAEVRNLLALLRTHGHVPNGARRYYLNRRRVQLICLRMCPTGLLAQYC